MKNNFALLSCAFLRVSEMNLFLKNFFWSFTLHFVGNCLSLAFVHFFFFREVIFCVFFFFIINPAYSLKLNLKHTFSMEFSSSVLF